MKKQHSNATKIVITVTVLASFLMYSCKNRHESTAVASISQTAAPNIDIYTAIITNNVEALKQHIAAGADLNQKDPLGGYSLFESF